MFIHAGIGEDLGCPKLEKITRLTCMLRYFACVCSAECKGKFCSGNVCCRHLQTLDCNSRCGTQVKGLQVQLESTSFLPVGK